MATQTQVLLIDDVDGGEAEENIQFGLDGIAYEIDLSSKNAQALREALQPWIDSGRKIGGRNNARTPKGKIGNRGAFTTTVIPDRHTLIRFAEEKGLQPPSTRGRVAQSLIDAWRAAGSPQY